MFQLTKLCFVMITLRLIKYNMYYNDESTFTAPRQRNETEN